MTDLISRDRFTCLTCGTVHYSSDAYIACRDSHPPPSLVDRLRFGSIDDDLLDAAKESADMIERLRAENSRMNTLLLDVQRRLDAATDDAERLRELLAEPQGEPVAWFYRSISGAQFVHFYKNTPRFLADQDAAEQWPDAHSFMPLYTHPPQQRKPFSHAQMADLIRAEWGIAEVPSAWNFGRAIERAHGIVEAP